MTQVRDAQTSELLYEGSPVECVALRAQLGSAVLYDGVGPAFDPSATLRGVAEAKHGPPDIPAKDVAEAKQARDDAQARVDQRGGSDN